MSSTLQAGVGGDVGRESVGQCDDGDGVVGGRQETETDLHPLVPRLEELPPLMEESPLVLSSAPEHHLLGDRNRLSEVKQVKGLPSVKTVWNIYIYKQLSHMDVQQSILPLFSRQALYVNDIS